MRRFAGLFGPRAVLSLLLCGYLLVAVAGGVSGAQSQPSSAAAPATGDLLLTLDPDKSEFHWTVDSTLHTVHGTFKFKSGQVKVNPDSGTASGEIVVPATSAESGNDGRDKKMHKDVLESAKYQDIVFKVDRVEGKIAASGSSTVLLHGTMNLHGTDHEFGAPVQAELNGDHWRATSKFVIPYIKWGLKSPNNFFLKVKPDVDVELRLSGTAKTAVN